MVYVDDAIWNWQGLKWCHLLADDIDELHGFAARLGISRASYQGPPKTTAPHYDLTGFERARALALGASPGAARGSWGGFAPRGWGAGKRAGGGISAGKRTGPHPRPPAQRNPLRLC